MQCEMHMDAHAIPEEWSCMLHGSVIASSEQLSCICLHGGYPFGFSFLSLHLVEVYASDNTLQTNYCIYVLVLPTCMLRCWPYVSGRMSRNGAHCEAACFAFSSTSRRQRIDRGSVPCPCSWESCLRKPNNWSENELCWSLFKSMDMWYKVCVRGVEQRTTVPESCSVVRVLVCSPSMYEKILR